MKKAEKTAVPSDLAALLKAVENVPVLVAGDVMLDRFVYGQVERISPESPVPVLSISRETSMPGGAGNTLANLRGMGASGAVLSVTGDDADGEELISRMKETGLDPSGIITDDTRPTIVKSRFLAGHQQLLRADFERRVPVSKETEDRLLQTAEKIIGGMKAVIISDYGKGMLTPRVVKGLIDLAHKKSIPVIVDPKGNDYSRYKGADVVTPNKKELSEATNGMNTSSDEDVVTAAQKLMQASGIKSVIATRSKDGMSVVGAKGEPLHLRGRDIEVFDVSGAGDTVVAVIGACLAAGGTLEQAAQLANIAGGIVVTKTGTAPIRIEELEDAVADMSSSTRARSRQAPLCTDEEAYEQVQRWKARGLKVGFTNGCFDVLHYGHVSYLNNARDHCDRLIIGLNHDASVKILKGPERPVHDEDSRAAVLGALGSVDMVVLFGATQKGGDNTANKIIARLQPNVYFKGGDYTEDQVPEAPGVRAYGGSVQIMPVYEGHSTTGSIKKIKTQAA
jgi:D-beta-D-heptose 7-phosphate kinase/D-beta-D-heptose 1-phosphate adenosyltransferase